MSLGNVKRAISIPPKNSIFLKKQFVKIITTHCYYFNILHFFFQALSLVLLLLLFVYELQA